MHSLHALRRGAGARAARRAPAGAAAAGSPGGGGGRRPGASLRPPAAPARAGRRRQQRRTACGASPAAAAGGGGGWREEGAAAVGGPSSRVLQTDGRQLAQLLWQLSELQVRPHQQWLQEVLDVLEPQLGELSAAELAGVLQVLGSWRYTPPARFLGTLGATAAARLERRELGLRAIADMAWGLAQLQNPSPQLLDDLLAAAGAAMAAAAAANAGGAVGAAATAPGAAAGAGSAVSASALADLLWSVAKLQHSPGEAWLAAFGAVSQPLLADASPHQLAQIVWACARLPWRPEPQAWVDALFDAVAARLGEFDAKSVSLVAWGMATLKLEPGRRWLFDFERRAEATLGELAASELACTLWALSELKSKRAHELRLGRLVRRQQRFWGYDYQLLTNPRLLRVVRSLTLGPQQGNAT